MFEAKLKSRSQPKLGALAVTFLIPEERYENVILALQNLQIGDVRKQDCCIESIRAPDCPALVRMTGAMANVDELDWLGKQLESFDRYELLQFIAIFNNTAEAFTFEKKWHNRGREGENYAAQRSSKIIPPAPDATIVGDFSSSI